MPIARNAECGMRSAEWQDQPPEQVLASGARRWHLNSAFRILNSALSQAPTDAGSAIRRPITSAITRTSRISWAN